MKPKDNYRRAIRVINVVFGPFTSDFLIIHVKQREH